ncbi:MAG TPA: molecular chaperone DnaJ [Azospirillaceae bacterium]|nr:molecular chaperone DnaJ [Azospirillaceae bacterium]
MIDREKGAAIEGGLHSCWMCRRAVSARALFCHGCGSVQPVRDLDHFARLGLERRFDIDLAQLNRQYVGFRRLLAPERFATRGAREKNHAKAHGDAFSAAYEALKDPIRRARHLLALEGSGEPVLSERDADEIGGWRAELELAGEGTDIDRIANRVTQEREVTLHRLAGVFRQGELDRAADEVARVEALDWLMDQARDRRASFPAGG